MSTSTQHKQEGFLPSVPLPRSNASISNALLRPTSAQFPHCRRLPLLCPFPPRACLSINRWWKPSLPSLVTDKTGRTKIQKAKLTSMGKPNDLLKSCMIVQLTPGRGEVKALQRGGWYQDVFYFRGKPRYFQTTEVMIHARHTGSLVL